MKLPTKNDSSPTRRKRTGSRPDSTLRAVPALRDRHVSNGSFFSDVREFADRSYLHLAFVVTTALLVARGLVVIGDAVVPKLQLVVLAVLVVLAIAKGIQLIWRKVRSVLTGS